MDINDTEDNKFDANNLTRVLNFEEVSLNIPAWCILINQWAERKGWNINFHDIAYTLPKEFVNFHSEISEAWEEYRKGRGIREVYYNYDLCNCGVSLDHVSTLALHSPGCPATKPEGIPIELADLVIRVMHTCGFYGMDLEGMIKLKMGYNETRENRHGEKRA